MNSSIYEETKYFEVQNAPYNYCTINVVLGLNTVYVSKQKVF